MTLMTETVAPVAKPVARPRPRRAATVSGSALAQHLDCSRTYIGKLEAEGVILRQGDGFPLDQSRIAYLRYLRRERQQSPRATADAEHASAKAALLRMRIEEKQRELVPRDVYDSMIDQMAGLVLTKLGSWPARVAGRDLGLRRRAEAVLRELRTELANACLEMAAKCGRLTNGCALECGVGFRQLRTCGRTRPGQLCAITGSDEALSITSSATARRLGGNSNLSASGQDSCAASFSRSPESKSMR